MRLLSILIFIIGFLNLTSQSLTTKVLSTAGSNYSLSGLSLDWTMGELAVSTYPANTLTLSEGFHQNYRIDPSTSLSYLQLQAAVEIFPNPVAKNVHLITQHPGKIHYSIIDIKGRRIIEGHFQNRASIAVERLDAGQYLIILTTSTKEKGIYSFVKSQ